MERSEVKFLILFLAMMILMEKTVVNANTVVTYINSNNIPSRARKAGGTYHQQEVPTFTNKKANYGHTYEEGYEKKCPMNQYWHIRGRRCVSDKCNNKENPTGKRDPDTGECLPVDSYSNKFSSSGYYGGVYRSTGYLKKTGYMGRRMG